MEADDKQQFELDEALAESHLQMKPAAFKHLEDVSKGQSKDTADDWRMRLSVAEVELSLA